MSRSCRTCHSSYGDEVFFCGRCGAITIQDQNGADFDKRLGERLGGYIVVARVADGAMGRVYEGRHPETKARVAIKVLHAKVARDQVSVERFKREYETAMELDHPNIVKVLEFGPTPDQSHFMTMEYLEGEELSKLPAGEKSLPASRIVRIICQIACALEHAHSFGFIHRDLKPDNIFLCPSDAGDVVRLLDFGSVKLQVELGPKLTAFGTTLGSPYYMSPEQALGRQDVDQQSDTFALAAIVYEMLTGRVAFEAEGVANILMKIMKEQPPPASSVRDLPPMLDGVIDQGLAKDKARRFRGPLALAEAFVRAWGLEASPGQYAEMDVTRLDETLRQVSPPSLAPQGVRDSLLDRHTGSLLPSMVPASVRPSVLQVPTSRGPGLVVGVALAALALVGAVALLM